MSRRGESSKKAGTSKGKGMIEEGLDWNERGKVTEVFDQGRWFMCWVIATLGVCESKYMIDENLKDHLILSKQELVNRYWSLYPIPANDKQENYDTYGFRTGSLQRGLAYVKEHGVCVEKDWPWTGGELVPIMPKPEGSTVYTITSFEKSGSGVNSTKWSERQVLAALKKHPVAAAIALTRAFMELPRGEIYRGPSKQDAENYKDPLYHAVLITRYRTDKRTKEGYYIIRNSWGKQWSSDGYRKVKRHLLSLFAYPTRVVPMEAQN